MMNGFNVYYERLEFSWCLSVLSRLRNTLYYKMPDNGSGFFIQLFNKVENSYGFMLRPAMKPRRTQYIIDLYLIRLHNNKKNQYYLKKNILGDIIVVVTSFFFTGEEVQDLFRPETCRFEKLVVINLSYTTGLRDRLFLIIKHHNIMNYTTCSIVFWGDSNK